MTEYGIFGDEGCIEDGFYSREDAARKVEHMNSIYENDVFEIHEICSEHEGQPKDGCEECPADDAEDVITLVLGDGFDPGECACGARECAYLGTLGNLDWYRCRACGLDRSVENS